MASTLVAGFAEAARRWPLVVVVWVLGALFGLAFSLVSGQWLDLALDASLPTRTLLKNLDVSVLVDLWAYHRESFALLLVSGAILGVGYLGLSVFLNAGVVKAVQDDDALMSVTFVRAALTLAPVFARLWLIAMTIDAIAIGAVALTVRLIMPWLAERPSEMPVYYSLAAAALLGAVLLVLLTAIHDHARIYAARREAGAARAYWWATRYVMTGDARALALALALVGAGGAVWLVYQTVGILVPATSSVTMTISLLWGQAFMHGRAWLRVVAFAAQAELQAEMIE